MVLEAILQVVPPEMMAGLAVKRTVKDAWEAIWAMCVNLDRVRKDKVQQLKKEFEMISFRDGKSVDDSRCASPTSLQASPRSEHLLTKHKLSRNCCELCHLAIADTPCDRDPP
jgi:hypothetical protein